MLSPEQQIDLSGAMDVSARVFDRLSNDWRETADFKGIYRPGYSAEEKQAFITVAREAAELGGAAYQDLAGNVHIHFESENPTLAPMMIGSHMDAVPSGGQYDGTAGVVAGLAAMKAIHDNGMNLPQDIILSAICAEESAWWKAGTFGIGSKFMAGQLSSDFLRNAAQIESERTIESHMQEFGLDTNALAAALDAGQAIFPLDRLGSYIEVHIEQGPSLLDARKSIGIVTDIRGNTRFPFGVNFIGKAAHSGATPQHLRQDAAIAASTFVTEWARYTRDHRHHQDGVFSVPDIHVVNPSATSVPERCFVMPEVRSSDLATLEETKKIIRDIADKAAKEWNCDFEIDDKKIVLGKPSHMDDGVHRTLLSKAYALGISAQSMPSGAGHDAGTFANAGVKSNMVFIRHGNGGISHNPNEILGLTDHENPFKVGSDFCNAVHLLSAYVAGGQAPEKINPAPFRELIGVHGIRRFDF